MKNFKLHILTKMQASMSSPSKRKPHVDSKNHNTKEVSFSNQPKPLKTLAPNML